MSDPVDIAQEREQIQRDEALARLAAQKATELSDGICEACGFEIGEQRLQALPTATTCIECARLEERRAKTISRGRA